MNIIDILTKIHANPKKTFAVLENGHLLTYGDLYTCVAKLSVVFYDLGLKQQDKILLSSNDKRSFIEILVAAYRFGLTVILVDTNAKYDRIQSIIESAQPNAFFIDTNLKTDWAIEGTHVVAISRKVDMKKKFFQKVFSKNTSLISDSEHDKNVYPACLNAVIEGNEKYPNSIDNSSIAYIIYTSGSTSDPKGVAISHENLFTHLDTLSKVYKLDKDCNILNLLNLYHADGVNQGPLLALYNGGTWFSPFKLDTSQLDLIYYALYKHQITHFFVVPTLLSFFEKYHEGFEDSFQTPHFKFMISVAAQLDARLWQSVSTIFKVQIVNIYGLTETVNGSIFCGPDLSTFKIGTIGKPVDCQIKIINDRGEEVEKYEKGELLLRGGHVMVGYFNNPIATQEVIKNGWLYTGDIAQEDEEGFIQIVGRKKSMINSGGFRTQPEEIEEIIMKRAGVFACKVVGMPDNILVEKIAACIQPEHEVALNELDLYQFFRENLEPEKVPHDIYLFDELPRGISGKIQVEKLKSMILNKNKGTSVKSAETLDTIRLNAAAIFRVNAQELNEFSSSSTVSGWDSLNNLVLITKLEELFNIEFSTAEIMVMNNISTINTIINKKIK